MGTKIYLNAFSDGVVVPWQSIELPDGIDVCCPNCGELAGDKESDCFLGIVEASKNCNEPATLHLLASCRKCGVLDVNKGPVLLGKYKIFKRNQ